MKLIHHAAKVNPKGGVAALCFKTPHPIDLRRASWTLRRSAVTCPKCLKLMEDDDGRNKTNAGEHRR